MLSISVALSYSKGIALPGVDVDGVLLDSFVSRIKNTSIHMPKEIFFCLSIDGCHRRKSINRNQ